jgi:hypothetical protein
MIEGESEKGWFQDKVQTVLGIPAKIVLASSLVVLNYLASRAQQHELRKVLKQVRDTQLANQDAK